MAASGTLRIKIRVFSGDEPALGPGRADLLAAIAVAGSISGAGRALGMSYRRAWLLVDSMNRGFAERLVATAAGGGRGAGARLTAAGERALALYRAIESEAEVVRAGASFRALDAMLRPQPLPPG